MIDPGAPIGPRDAAFFRPRAQPTTAPAARTPDFSVTLSRELEGPPPELRAEMDAAARRWEDLQAMNRELHFREDPESGRIVVDVRDLDGRLIRTVPPSAALNIAAGEPLP